MNNVSTATFPQVPPLTSTRGVPQLKLWERLQTLKSLEKKVGFRNRHLFIQVLAHKLARTTRATGAMCQSALDLAFCPLPPQAYSLEERAVDYSCLAPPRRSVG